VTGVGPVRDSANLLTDNPELYEAQFPDPEHRAARFVADLVARFAPQTDPGSDTAAGTGSGPPAGNDTGSGGGRRLLDVGCGTGRDAAHLAELGWAVTGIEISPRMLAHARSRYPGVRFLEGDMREVALPDRFTVVTCLDSTLLHCHDTADLTAVLTRCHDHLVPGGLLVAEMRNGAYFLGGGGELLDAPRTRTVLWRDTPYTSHTLLWLDHAEQLLRRRRTWSWPGCPDPLVQHSAWRLLFPRELRHLLETTGFEVVALFDGPGPRTEPPWQPGGAEHPLGTTLTGDRLHLVARRRPDPPPA
jgi:SAM-dependent methyltransferase